MNAPCPRGCRWPARECILHRPSLARRALGWVFIAALGGLDVVAMVAFGWLMWEVAHAVISGQR